MLFKRQFYTVNKNLIDWLIFFVLSVVWGSSFILMKIGLESITAQQVAAIRIASSGLVLLPLAIRSLKQIPGKKLLIVFISGMLGNLIPAFLFCKAEEGIDSALAGALNSLTPIFVVIMGALFFRVKTSQNKIVGIVIAITGSFLLLVSKENIKEGQHLGFILMIVLATILYGFNVNMVYKYLADIKSLHIVAVALVLNAIPAILILGLNGYFHLPFSDKKVLMATGAAILLGVIGTAVATILFYMLMKRAGSIFASMVTYGIPFIAIGWGMVYGEIFGWRQVACLFVILLGVYWANKPETKKIVTSIQG